jgi:hypothetical protein
LHTYEVVCDELGGKRRLADATASNDNKVIFRHLNCNVEEMEELCEPKLLKNKNKHMELSPTRASHAERRPTKTKKESVNADPNPTRRRGYDTVP